MHACMYVQVVRIVRTQKAMCSVESYSTIRSITDFHHFFPGRGVDLLLLLILNVIIHIAVLGSTAHRSSFAIIMHAIPHVPVVIIVVICIIVFTRYRPTPQSSSFTLDSLCWKYGQKMIATRQLLSRLQVGKARIGRYDRISPWFYIHHSFLSSPLGLHCRPSLCGERVKWDFR
jgi:hypothetical protein